MANPFVPRRAADIGHLVTSYPLCWLVSDNAGERLATPLPLLAETTESGNVRALFGHMGLSNPQHAALVANPGATILAMGPQGYISPQLVSNSTWGPTWNYAVCRFEVRVEFVAEETDAALSRLAEALEGSGPGNWTPTEMGGRYEELKQRIIAFRAHVLETHARFKLGQDEDDSTFEEIVNGLDNQDLASWMRQARS